MSSSNRFFFSSFKRIFHGIVIVPCLLRRQGLILVTLEMYFTVVRGTSSGRWFYCHRIWRRKRMTRALVEHFVLCQSKTRHVLVMVSLEVLHFVVWQTHVIRRAFESHRRLHFLRYMELCFMLPILETLEYPWNFSVKSLKRLSKMNKGKQKRCEGYV
jgi:hypothetical protein